MHQFGGHGSRNCDAHGCKPIGNEASIGAIAVVIPCNPHLVGPHIGDQNIFGGQHLPNVINNFLRLNRKCSIACILFIIFTNFRPQLNRKGFWLMGAIGASQQLQQRIRNIAYHFHLGDVATINFSGHCTHMDNWNRAVRIPALG